jgi:hypothetical protein
MNIHDFNLENGKTVFRTLMNSPEPAWIGRTCGSDTDFVELWNGQSVDDPLVTNVKRLNGYYDLSNSIHNLNKFRDAYIHSCHNMDLCLVHMSGIFGKSLENCEKTNNTLENKYGIHDIMCWRFIENCTYFLESFKEWGKDKKILVVSPFSASITYQTMPERVPHLHLPEFSFPRCEFQVCSSPVTYNTPTWNCDGVFKEHTCWFDSAESLYREIKEKDFDIVWLSCGSYAMYLGERIKNELGKKAIYIGGMLNVFFNLYNFRYSSTGHDLAVINPKYQIESFENAIYYTKENLTPFPYSEGLKAYFGHKK